jgi:hypothetical protein
MTNTVTKDCPAKRNSRPNVTIKSIDLVIKGIPVPNTSVLAVVCGKSGIVPGDEIISVYEHGQSNENLAFSCNDPEHKALIDTFTFPSRLGSEPAARPKTAVIQNRKPGVRVRVLKTGTCLIVDTAFRGVPRRNSGPGLVTANMVLLQQLGERPKLFRNVKLGSGSVDCSVSCSVFRGLISQIMPPGCWQCLTGLGGPHTSGVKV